MRSFKPLRREVERGISFGRWNAEERGHQDLRLVDLLGSLCEQGLELLELLFGTIVAREPGGSLEPGDNRMECRVRGMGRAIQAERGVWADELLTKHSDEPRLSDTGLAGEQHNLAVAVPGPLPAVKEKREFLLTADKREQACGVQRFEATLAAALTAHLKSSQRLRKALQLAATEIRHVE